MIIGNGLIGSAMQSVDDNDTIIFASGVSDSQEARESEFDRERELLNNNLNKSMRLIYFSTVPKGNSRYMTHKKEMESIVEKNYNYLILRVQYIVGNGGCETNLFNFLKLNLINGSQINIFKNSYRTFFDVEDLVKLVKVLKTCQGVVTVSGVEMMPVKRIVEMMATYLRVQYEIKLIDSKPERQIANDEIIDAWLYRLGIARENYVESVIKKYC